MKSLSLAIAISLALALPCAAQSLQVNMLPSNSVPVNTQVTIQCWDAYAQGLSTPFGCLVMGIHQGNPTGPNVAFFPCTFLPGPIPPCGSANPRLQQWTPTTPGEYWVEIQHAVGGFGPTVSEFFCLRVTAAGATPPTLSAFTSPTIGTNYVMSIDAPGRGGDNYLCAMAGTTNVGIPLGAVGHFCLDLDPIFSLSFPNPSPLFFSNFQGALNNVGQSGTIAFIIPNDPALLCIPLHIQGVIVPGPMSTNPNIELTNDLSFWIQ